MRSLDGVGRVGLPKDIRERFGLKEGSIVNIEEGDGYIKVIPAKIPDYKLTETNMDFLRKLYNNLKENNLVDENAITQLGKILKVTDNTCINCGANLFVTNDKKYECVKCKL